MTESTSCIMTTLRIHVLGSGYSSLFPHEGTDTMAICDSLASVCGVSGGGVCPSIVIEIVDENNNELGIDQTGGLALPPRNSSYFAES